ncbi:CpaF family protein [Sulfitobacter guttiformis]|uniref:Pilus assembly protein CpaF n=1 Tax=Sulfitobacter guttiformis TaxID=74349 RepID=A0A420DK72_9RHOB|nr:CpaF family protein [Sulfitobacter guttiformis]KIN71541.1 Type II secretion system protein E [Sulfitobacter guttiformis KCTC 32187]RKE94622.1 pilus assembly protein CpaF [Sulfitobacter guttiformis]
MTLLSPNVAMDDALSQVLDIAKQINAAGLSAAERANVAVSYVIENSGVTWPLSVQREILKAATAALAPGTPSANLKPVLEVVPATPAAVKAATPAKSPQPRPQRPEAPKSAAQIEALPKTTPLVREPSGDLMNTSNEVVKALSTTLDFSKLVSQPRVEQEQLIRDAIRTVSEERKMRLNGREVSDLVTAVLADMLGLGPLEALLADDTVTDIMVNGPHQVYVERSGKLVLTNIRFRDNAHVFAVASRIVAAVGRRIDESQPMVDARLKDGSRVNVAVPPLAIDGPTITIRKFPANPVKLEALVKGGSMTQQMADFLAMAAILRLNILVSGGTGSGKTTLMNAMSQFIPEGERLVTIEDAAELRFQQPHVVRFETRPPNVEGTGEITMRTLVRNALRMRPDRIIIGEIRGDEVLDLLQAMNTGHDGSMSTLHANTPREALTRVESMAALAGFAPGTGVVRRQLVDAVHLIIQVSRMRDGKRRITSISEIAGLAGDAITLQELFTFDADPSSTRAEVKGEFRYSGYRPKFARRAAEYGLGDALDALLGG